MDARVKTNMPNPRCLNSIDSKSHGQILWCPIDSGLVRIGYVFSQALLEKYGGVEGVTQEVAVKEAIQALQPFEVEFLEVDWFTIYVRSLFPLLDYCFSMLTGFYRESAKRLRSRFARRIESSLLATPVTLTAPDRHKD